MFNAGEGPIPGENYTSDTKNYPWHSPPQYTDIDKALDDFSNKITKPDVANGILTIIELGFPIYKVTSMLVMAGVMNGKWTVDFGLMLAGPIARIIEILCIGYGIEYDLGINDDEEMTTGEFYKVLGSPLEQGSLENYGDSGSEEPPVDQKKEEPNIGSMGFMKQQTGGAE